MDNLSVILIILLAILVMGLAIAGVIIYRYLHSSRTFEFQSKIPPPEVSPEIQPSTGQIPETLSPEVSLAPVAESGLPMPDLGDTLAREEELTIEYEGIGELPPNKSNISDTVMDTNEAPTQISTPTPSAVSKPPIPRIDRVGRRKGSFQSEESEQGKISRRKPRALKPEVVCWYEARKWFVGLETPEEFQEYTGLTVTQDGAPLTHDDKDRWALIKANGKASVSWDEVEQPIEIDLNDRPYLLFKLSGKNIDRGRLIRYAAVGWFLVIVPDEWKPNEESSGSAIPLPERVFIDGYRAHGFNREDARKIMFVTPQGELFDVLTRASRFKLVGHQLPDASEDIGPLFGNSPPRIHALDKNVWSDVKTIVVGQEGTGRKRWRTEFSPEAEDLEQGLPSELSEKGGGWYFIRFYDAVDRLVESLDFRFMKALKDIRISPHSALPGDSGHLAARVEFLHDRGCVVKLADSSEENLSVEHEDKRTSATIPPDPIWDETRWLIQVEEGAQVEAKILVERVWWALGEDGGEKMPVGWMDRPFNISRDLVTATSKHVLRFRLPRPRWVKEIRVGFERWKTRAYYVEVAKREVAVSLSHFEGAQELEDQAREYMLKLWIKDDASQDVSVVVAVIPATQPALIETGRARSDVRRMRNYLKRLGHRIQDSALRQMISETREKWSASSPRSETGSYRIETSCVIVLAWENFRANGIKPLGHRKRWLRRFVGLAANHPDTMQEIREKYETLKRGRTNASSRPKR